MIFKCFFKMRFPINVMLFPSAGLKPRFRFVERMLIASVFFLFLALAYTPRPNVVEPISDIITRKSDTAYTARVEPPSKTQEPMCVIKPSGSCYYAKATQGYLFSAWSEMHLPQEGSVGGYGGDIHNRGVVDNQFYQDMVTHETWHRRIYEAYLKSVWEQLEKWSASYESNTFRTREEATSKFDEDMKAAYNEASRFAKTHQQLQNDHPSPGGHVINGTWRAIYPDWGQNDVSKAEGFKPNFKKQRGTCQ